MDEDVKESNLKVKIWRLAFYHQTLWSCQNHLVISF